MINNSELLSRFSTGVDNQVFLGQNEGGYFVLKVYTKRTMAEVEHIARTNRAATHMGFPVPKVLRVGTTEGRPWMKLNYIQGSHFHFPTIEQLSEVAKVMARLHSVPPPRHLLRLTSSSSLWRQLLVHVPARPAELLSEVLSRAEENIIGTLPVGFVHGDVSQTNLLFDQVGLRGLLDFDHSGIAPVVIDLARASIFFSFDEHRAFDANRDSVFLDAYQSVRRLSAAERIALPEFRKVLLIRMIVEMFYYVHVAKTVPVSTLRASPMNPTLEGLVGKLENVASRHIEWTL